MSSEKLRPGPDQRAQAREAAIDADRIAELTLALGAPKVRELFELMLAEPLGVGHPMAVSLFAS